MGIQLRGHVSTLAFGRVSMQARWPIRTLACKHVGNLPDGEPEGVDLAEPLLVGKGGDVLPQTLKRFVDALHSPSQHLKE